MCLCKILLSVNMVTSIVILTDVIIWEMHGFPHKFPTVRENATKPMVREKSGKSITMLLP